MGVEDNLFQIQDLDAQTTFYDWVSKENNEIIEKLNLMSVYSVKGGTGINLVLGTTANAGLTFINGVTLTYTTGEALVSLDDEVPGVTFAGSVVVTGNLQVQDGTKATTIVTSVNGKTGAVTLAGITGGTGSVGATGVAPQPILISENQLINGSLDVWQRGITFTGSTAMRYFADRWAIFYKTQTGEYTNTTDIVREKFESNQTDVAGSPKYYANLHFDRGVLRSSSDLIGVENRMENPTKFLDEKIYVDGYVRGGTQENLGLYIRRSPDGVTHYTETFGSGDIPKGTTWAPFLSSHVVRYRKGETYDVKVVAGPSYNYFSINGVTQGGLTLDRGFEYTFDLSDSSLSSHPFALSTTQNGTHNGGVQYHTGYSVSDEATQGNTGASARLRVSYGAPSNLYYFCSVHPGVTHATGMGGTGSVRGALATEDGYVAVGLDLTRSAHATGDGLTLDYAKFRVFSSQAIESLTTSPYREESDVDKELKDCFRFYQRSFGLEERSGDKTTMTKNNPNFSPVRFVLPPSGEHYHEFITEMRKNPTVTVYSPVTGVTQDAFNKSSGFDLRLSSGTVGYGGANRIHVAGADTISTDPFTQGILIKILSGSVPFDDIFVNYVADSDFTI